jgi:hypothetical protein
VRKEYRYGFIKIILTDEDLVFYDEGEEVHLAEETSWWDESGWVYIYEPELSRLQKVGVGVHEFVEMVLIKKLKMPRNWAHRVANVLEYIVSLGKADLYWR